MSLLLCGIIGVSAYQIVEKRKAMEVQEYPGQLFKISDEKQWFREMNISKCQGDYTRFRAMNISMGNNLNGGSYIYYGEKVPFSELKLWDRISFNKPMKFKKYEFKGKKVHHAIIAIGENFVITQGYNNGQVDNYRVYAKDIIARDCLK